MGEEEGKMWEKGEEKGDIFFVSGTVVYEWGEKALNKGSIQQLTVSSWRTKLLSNSCGSNHKIYLL